MFEGLDQKSMKGITKFCKKADNSDVMMERLEKTWKTGFDFGSGRIDNEYLIGLNKMRSKVIPLESVVWAYKHIATQYGKIVRVDLTVGYNTRKLGSCVLDDTAIARVLDYIMKNCPDIAVGHNKEADKFFRKRNMEALKEYANAQRST